MQPNDVILPDYTIKDLSKFDIEIPMLEYNIPTVGSSGEVDPMEKLRVASQNPELTDSFGAELWRTSASKIGPFNKPQMPVYNPYVDMEDAYAKSDPFNFGDVLYNTWKTFTNQLGHSYTSFVSGIKDGSLWDNEANQAVAQAMKELQEESPLYRTKDERDNPYAFRNWGSTSGQILPAFGTIGAAMADIVIGHIAATTVGSLASPVGAGALNAAQLAKDANTIRTLYQTLFGASKALTTGFGLRTYLTTGATIGSLATKANALKASHALATGLFYANGEAGLQAKLGSDSYLERESKRYYDTYGHYPTGEDLDQIKEDALKVGNATYRLNLPLIAASNMLQFGNLLLGKGAPKLASQLPIAFRPANGVVQATKKSVGFHLFKDLISDGFTEGLEEYAQGVIDNAVSDYYSPVNSDRSMLTLANMLGKHAMTDITTQEGQMNFLGGALIGGLTGAAKFARYNSVSQAADDLISNFNSATRIMAEGNMRSGAIRNQMQEAFNKNDLNKVDELTQQEAFNFAHQGFHTGTIEGRMSNLESLKDLSIEEFNKMMNLDWTKDERDTYIDSVIRNIKKADSILQQVENAFSVNPFVNDVWYTRKIEDLITKMKGGQPSKFHDVGAKIWNDFKSVVSQSVYRGTNITEMVNEQKELFEEDSYLIDSDLKKVVATHKERLKDQIAAGIDVAENQSLLDKIDGMNTVDAYDAIIKDIFDDPEYVAYVTRMDATGKALLNQAQKWQTRPGMKSLLSEIGDYLEYVYLTERKPETKVVQKPDGADDEPEEPIEEDTLEEINNIVNKLANGEALTPEEQIVYNNNKDEIDSLITPQSPVAQSPPQEPDSSETASATKGQPILQMSPQNDVEAVVMTKENYNRWSNVRDGSDIAQFEDQIRSALKALSTIKDPKPEDVDDYLKNIKAFADSTLRKKVVDLLSSPSKNESVFLNNKFSVPTYVPVYMLTAEDIKSLRVSVPKGKKTKVDTNNMSGIIIMPNGDVIIDGAKNGSPSEIMNAKLMSDTIDKVIKAGFDFELRPGEVFVSNEDPSVKVNKVLNQAGVITYTTTNDYTNTMSADEFSKKFVRRTATDVMTPVEAKLETGAKIPKTKKELTLLEQYVEEHNLSKEQSAELQAMAKANVLKIIC